MQLELDLHRESEDPTPVQDPVQAQPSAFPTKAIKKSKPSKKILSQTVVYKEKEKAPKSERKSPEQQEETEVDLVVTSPTPTLETAESGEEQMPAEGEETREEIPVTEKVESDSDKTTEVKINDNDDETKPGEEENTGKEQEKDAKMEKEKEEQEQKEKQVEKVIPKSEFINM